MELRQLATFRMVATTLSFSRTATALNYVQSSVTAQIQALEEELGVRLFDRLGKRVALTDAGRQLLQYAERLLDLAAEARGALVQGEAPTGSLTISAPETLWIYRLPALLRQFQRRFPQVHLIFRPAPFADLRRRVSEGSVDVAFVLEQPIRSKALLVEALLPEPLLLLASPEHPLARVPSIRVHDLEGESLVLTEAGCGYRTLLERALHEGGVFPGTTLELSSVEAIKQCVIAGMGVAFLPAVTVAAELAQGRLAVVHWEGQPFQVVTQMLWHREKWRSPAISAFLSVARELLSAREEGKGSGTSESTSRGGDPCGGTVKGTARTDRAQESPRVTAF